MHASTSAVWFWKDCVMCSGFSPFVLGSTKTLFAAPWMGVGPKDWGFPGVQRQDRAQLAPLPSVL